MQFRNLGHTGLKVSRIGLGCGNFGGIGSLPAFFGKGESEEQSFALMDMAWDMGINLFDTANSYGGGRSETYIGNWLKQKGSSVRAQIILATKVFNPIGDGPNDRGLSRRHIMQQIDISLSRLGVDYVDMYLIHEPDFTTPIEETLRALDDLIHQGKVRYIGASNMPTWLTAKALWVSDKFNLYRFEWIQNSYSLLDRFDEREMLPLCRDQELGFTPFSPLAGGLLTGKYRYGDDYPSGSRLDMRPDPYLQYLRKQTFDALERFRAESEQRGVSMAGLALAWLLSNPDVTAPIVGPRKPSHLDPVREALDITLSYDERARIAALLEPQGE